MIIIYFPLPLKKTQQKKNHENFSCETKIIPDKYKRWFFSPQSYPYNVYVPRMSQMLFYRLQKTLNRKKVFPTQFDENDQMEPDPNDFSFKFKTFIPYKKCIKFNSIKIVM